MSVAKIIIQTLRRNIILTSGMAAVITAAIVTSLLPPLILERMINLLADGTGLSLLTVFSYFLTAALSGILDAFKEVLINAFGQKMTHAVRTGMTDKLRRLPASYFTDNDPGATASRIVGDVSTVDGLFTSGIISMAADLCRVISILYVVLSRNAGLFVLLTAVLPLIFLFTRRVQKRMLS